MKKLTFDKNTPRSTYEELYEREVGDVFKVADCDYETVLNRIELYAPSNKSFEVFPITPGTSLYTTYGAEHCVVVKNEPISG